ncbi:MAG: NADPH:quinone reductase [Limisphaerales bacterium]
MKLEEVPEPAPGPDQVLIEVKAIGVNPVDTYIRAGAYSISNLPYTPGFDCAGFIKDVGEGVTRFKAGDRIYTSGTVTGAYAEFAVADCAKVHSLPRNCDIVLGAALGIPYATAFRALFQKAQARAAETVFIHGASGGVGLAAVQLGRAAGLTVIGTASTPEGQELVREHGAHHVLNHKAAGYEKELTRFTYGRGVNVILEMLANVNLGKDLTLLAKYGRVVVIGSRGKIEIDPRDTMSRDATILGMTLFNASPSEIESIHAALYAGIELGTIAPIIGKRFALADAAKAHVAILEAGAYGKIILLPPNEGANLASR